MFVFDSDDFLLFEDGTAHGRGKGEDDAEEADLEGRRGPGHTLQRPLLLHGVHHQGDQHHALANFHETYCFDYDTQFFLDA